MMVAFPGDFSTKKTKTYPAGRRCQCGTILSVHNSGALCSVCERNPRPAWDGTVEAETMSTKQVADLLGIHAREVRGLADAGFIDVTHRGRGLWSSKYDKESVLRYHDQVTLEKHAAPQQAEPEQAEQPEPEQVEQAEPEQSEPWLIESVDEPKKCCGKRPEGDEDCRNCPELDHSDAEPGDEPTQYFDFRNVDLTTVFLDAEIEAMNALVDKMPRLDHDARIRVLQWAWSRWTGKQA